MPRTITKVSVFIASPGDVAAERDELCDVINELNLIFAPQHGIELDLKRWETHAWPGFGEDAQAVINDRIGAYDIFIGILWNRLGTPTGRSPSGTVEEFRRAYELWKQHKRPSLMFYFRRSPSDLSTVDEIKQKLQVVEFKHALQGMGALFWEYPDLKEF